MAAEEFSNGENLGVVRTKLNKNAREINRKVDVVEGSRLMTSSEASKLNGIAANASANSTDAVLVARASHTGTQSADTIVDGTANKVYTGTEKTKLSGVATGATANSTDAALRTRSTHTGTQSADTITDGTTNRVYTATEKTKLGGIAEQATKNDTDLNLKNRANHTGSQAISTVTNLQAAIDARTPVVSTSPIKPTGIWYGTQAQYDAITTKVSTVKYEIFEV